MHSILIIFFLLSFGLGYGQHTVSVYVNNVKTGACISKEETKLKTLSTPKKLPTSIKQLRIQVAGGYMNSNAYKKELEIKLGDSSLGVFPESAIYKNGFDITKATRKLLYAGKKLEVVLLLNPANDRMMIPSRMVPLCYLAMK